MKYLNRYFRECSLNKKIRYWYDLKQQINNSRLPDFMKVDIMNYCDREINACWRNSSNGVPGYVIISGKVNS